jgi:hypothetical protein
MAVLIFLLGTDAAGVRKLHMEMGSARRVMAGLGDLTARILILPGAALTVFGTGSV